MLFCGEATAPGRGYCPAHRVMAVDKGTASERAAVRDARKIAAREGGR